MAALEASSEGEAVSKPMVVALVVFPFAIEELGGFFFCFSI